MEKITFVACNDFQASIQPCHLMFCYEIRKERQKKKVGQECTDWRTCATCEYNNCVVYFITAIKYWWIVQLA